MAHNHGSEYQVKVIHEDGAEALSEWIEHGNVARTMAALRKPQARAYWLRERNVTRVAACPLCRDRETAIAEYPLTDCLSPRNRLHACQQPSRETFPAGREAGVIPMLPVTHGSRGGRPDEGTH
jgi:hypothetical protein